MKAYKKPEVYFEHFELSEHIAACDIKLTTADAKSCKGTMTEGDPDMPAGSVVFATGFCGIPYDDFCYQNGGENQLSTFMS